MATLLSEKGIRVETDENFIGIPISSVRLRRSTLLRQFYVIDIETHAKYPTVGGFTAADGDEPHEVYISASPRTIYYGGGDDGVSPMEDGIPGMSVLRLSLPRKVAPGLWHRLLGRDKWNRPQWHLSVSESDKYNIQFVAWYGRY